MAGPSPTGRKAPVRGSLSYADEMAASVVEKGRQKVEKLQVLLSLSGILSSILKPPPSVFHSQRATYLARLERKGTGSGWRKRLLGTSVSLC